MLVLLNKKAPVLKASKSTTKLNDVVKIIKQNNINKIIQTLPQMASLRSKVALGFEKMKLKIRMIEFFCDMIICEKLFDQCILYANFNNLILVSKLNRLKVLYSPPVEITKKFLSILAVMYLKHRPVVNSISKTLPAKYRTL